MLLADVVPKLPTPSVIVVPSTTIDSFTPSTNPLTLKVKLVIVWPLSTVFVAALL